MNAAQVKRALRIRHARAAGEWECIEEAFSGFATYQTGGIDLLAVGVWKSAKVPGLLDCGKVTWDHTVSPAAVRRDSRNATVAYEVKVSRGDFRRELYGYEPKGQIRRPSVAPWPGKARWAIDHTNYFMFAVPAGLLHEDEIQRREPWIEPPRRGALYLPPEAGLVEVDERGCHVRVPAAFSEAEPWSRHETHELLRRAVYLAHRDS